MLSRHWLFFGTPLLAFCMHARADESQVTLRAQPTVSRIVELIQKPETVLREKTPADNMLRNEPRPKNVAEKEPLSDNAGSTTALQGNVIRLKEVVRR